MKTDFSTFRANQGRNRNRSFFFLAFFAIMAAFSLSPQSAISGTKKIKIPEEATKALVYILGFMGKEAKPEIDVSKTASVIDFVLSGEKIWPAMYYSEDELGPESAYHEFIINQSLPKVLMYAYSPMIPSHVMMPSSIRLSFWKKFNGEKQSPYLWTWNFPAREGKAQTASGIEYEETTPDVFSGSYYGYDMDRLLVLFRLRGRNIFFSASRQKEKSPGKKAFALGDDQEWTYLYTDQTGMNKSGMGWVKPYMYESFAVTVFVEQHTGADPSVKCSMFKWLSAGAAGINMVSTSHINAGIKRFESAFKTVLENPRLPPANKLSETFFRIDNLPFEGVKNEIRRYLGNLERRYKQDEVFQDDDLAELFTSRKYLNQLSREQMEGILDVEYMKQVLGKNPIIRVLAPPLQGSSRTLSNLAGGP